MEIIGNSQPQTLRQAVASESRWLALTVGLVQRKRCLELKRRGKSFEKRDLNISAVGSLEIAHSYR